MVKREAQEGGCRYIYTHTYIYIWLIHTVVQQKLTISVSKAILCVCVFTVTFDSL